MGGGPKLAVVQARSNFAGMSEPRVTGPTVTDWCCVRFEAQTLPTIVVRDRVRLSDTDSSGRIYYGAVTPWLTRAQAELWLALGFKPQGLLPYPMMPVVNANISYQAQLSLAEEYELRGWIERAGKTSISLGFEISSAGQRCVSAEMTHVHLSAETMRPAPLPEVMVASARVKST